MSNVLSNVTSKLPDVGTTIFAVMSAMAQKNEADNLAQGFPEFDPDPWLRARVAYYIEHGANQYAPMPGTEQLRQAIQKKTADFYDVEVDIDSEITVTSGATEAIFAAIQSVTKPGDEVIIFDPAYDCYDPAVRLSGGKAVHLPLDSHDFAIQWDLLEQAFNQNTRLIIINSPHNPTGAVLSADDLDRLARLIKDSQCLLISDEVYEHIIFDGQEHASVLRHPELKERSFVVSSFGKTYHMTGWKIGYCIAPHRLTVELRKLHQFLTFSTSTPMQLAIADMIAEKPDYPRELAKMYQSKRDCFVNALANSRFRVIPCHGTYFQLLDYSAISNLDDMAFTRWLTENHQVATIPISPFCQPANPNYRFIRCCFAKSEETLVSVAERLALL